MSMHPNAPLPQGPHQRGPQSHIAGPPVPQPGPPPQGPQRPAGPVGGIVVNVQGNRATSSLVPPTVQIDGLQFPTDYGRNHYQVPAGRRRVFVSAQWLRTYGQATLDVDVPAGGTVEVYYAAPLHQFTTGSIGFDKQRANGRGCFVALMVVLALIVAIVIILPLVFA